MCNIFILLVLLLFNLNISICTVTTNSIPLEIINNGNKYFQCKSSDIYTLLERDEAEVVINHKYVINKAGCKNSKADKDNPYTGEFLGRNQTQTRLKIINIQPGPWSCTFLTLHNVINVEPSVFVNGELYTGVNCDFKVRVRLYNSPNVSINNTPVEIKRTNLSTSEYDYAGYYFFKPGFPFNIKFLTLKEDARIRFSLTSVSNSRTFINTTRGNRNMNMILTEEHDNTYLDCTYSMHGNDLTLRLYMHVNNLETIAKENPNNITLNIVNNAKNGKLMCDSASRYIILDRNDAEVIVNHNNMIKNAKCYYNGNSNDIFTGNITYSSRTQTRLQINSMKSDDWKCNISIRRATEHIIIYNHIKYDEIYCELKVHIRKLKGPSISYNKIPLEITTQGLSTSEYDYVGYYFFQPGLPVHIECVRPIKNTGSIEFTLKSASNQHTFINTSHEYMDRYIGVKLTEEHNNTYLDFNYSTNELDLLARIHMYINKRMINEKDSLIITINGERLESNPILNKKKNETVNYILYDMRYINDNDITITCVRHAESQGELKLKPYKVNGDYKTYTPTANGDTIYISIPSNKITEGSEITCSLKMNEGTFNNYLIKFMTRSPRNDLIVTGLSNRNILFDIEKSTGLIHEIQYQYKDGDTLNLSCSCTKSKCTKASWTINDDIDHLKNANTVSLTLDHSHNNTVIKCVKESTNDTLRLILYKENAATVSTTTIPNTSQNIGTKNNNQWYIISGMCVCLMVVLLGFLIFCLRNNKTKKLQTEPQGIDYETLQSNNEAPSHFDVCNTYSEPLDGVDDSQYSVPYKPNVNDLYAKPIPKSKRSRQEVNEYADINNLNKLNNDSNDVTYAELSLAKPKDIYAEVIPKSQRNTRHNQPESNYAEFYAEAIPVTECHYGNVSDNQRYVNNDERDDYAEPAYCELLVKRRMK